MNRIAEAVVGLPQRSPHWAIVPAWTLIAVICGVALAVEPLLAFLPVVALAAIPLVLSPQVRFFVVVFGALLVFQTSDELSAPKLAYLFALMVTVGATLVRLPFLATAVAYQDLKPMLRASVVTLGLVAASLPVSHLNGVPPTTWLRDIAPYVMVAFAPLIALDAQASLSARALRWALIVGGTLSALTFTARWLTNRAIADFDFLPIGLPTMLLATTVFAYGFAVLLHGDRHRLAWAALTSVIAAMLLSTGTRTALILFAAPLAIVLGSQVRLTQRTVRLVIAAPLVALLVFLGAQAVLGVTNADRDALAGRTQLFFATGDRVKDQSYVERLAQTSASWDAFRSSPIFGTGPGTPFVWTNARNEVQVSQSVDSPISFLAKFGILGLIAAGFLVVGFVSTLRAFRRRTRGPTYVQLGLGGFAAVVLAWSMLQNPYEDKGFAIGLMLFLAVAAREASEYAGSRDSAPRTRRETAGRRRTFR